MVATHFLLLILHLLPPPSAILIQMTPPSLVLGLHFPCFQKQNGDTWMHNSAEYFKSRRLVTELLSQIQSCLSCILQELIWSVSPFRSLEGSICKSAHVPCDSLEQKLGVEGRDLSSRLMDVVNHLSLADAQLGYGFLLCRLLEFVVCHSVSHFVDSHHWHCGFLLGHLLSFLLGCLLWFCSIQQVS